MPSLPVFIRVSHPDVTVEAEVPETALPHMPGWTRVDAAPAETPEPPATAVSLRKPAPSASAETPAPSTEN